MKIYVTGYVRIDDSEYERHLTKICKERNIDREVDDEKLWEAEDDALWAVADENVGAPSTWETMDVDRR